MSTGEQEVSNFEFELYDRPGKDWSPLQKVHFVNELRSFASKCLNPLPDYQCLSFAPDALSDKLIVVARRSTDSEIVAFTSAVFLPIGPLASDKSEYPYRGSFDVFHTGLTCISPEIRRQGMTIELFARIFIFMTAKHPKGCWLTNLAEVPSSLVSISHYATRVFPSPFLQQPSPMHLHIADWISKHHRQALLIAPNATFDPSHFVFLGSNPPGSCFRKSRSDKQFHHRRTALNEFYRDLLGPEEGNEVLQVAYISRDRIVEANNEEERLRRPLVPLQVK